MSIYTTEARLWWQRFQADPKANFEKITLFYDKKDVVSCQYFVKGYVGVCINWLNGGCVAEPEVFYEDGKVIYKYPSGYSEGKCDFIGRRFWCNRYNGGEESSESDGSDDWHCVAIAPEKSGLLLNEQDEQGRYYTRKVEKDEVEYCEEDSIKGIGRCDGWGCGRGCVEESSVEELLKLPIKCKFYKPWLLGFGAIEPQTYHRAIRDYQDVYDKSYEYFIENPLFRKRIPLSFQVYNLRAQTQTCHNWKGTPSLFHYYYMDDEHDYIDLSEVSDGGCDIDSPYSKVSDEGNESLTRKIWSEEGTIICNGAKPECPYYTGTWNYCSDKKMVHGSPVTALQIMELRFWLKDWESQAQYDSFFEARPNWTDETTPDICTFHQWERQDLIDTSKSVMRGFRFSMCQPVPETKMKRFDTDVYISIYPLLYPPLDIRGDTGTSSYDSIQYPTLIRGLFQAEVSDLHVTYPYRNDDENAMPCYDYETYCEKRSNSMDGDFISVIGNVRGAKQVFAMNLNHINWPYPYNKFFMEDEYRDIDDITSVSREDFFNYINEEITNILINHRDYIVPVVPNEEGVFITPPRLPLDYNENNDILILANYENGHWRFKKRKVFSKFYGGLITQTNFDFSHGGDQYLPGVMMPAGKAYAAFHALGNSIFSTCYALRSGFSITGTCNPGSIDTNYSLKVLRKNDRSGEGLLKRVLKIGSSNYIWLEIDDLNLNYIYNWVFNKGHIVIRDEDGNESGTVELEGIYPIGENISDIYMDSKSRIRNFFRDATPTIEKLSIPPNAFIVRPKGHVNLSNVDKGDIVLSYSYFKLCLNDDFSCESDSDESEQIWPPENVWGSISNTSSNAETTGPMNLFNASVTAMGFFVDEDGRAIVAFATRMYGQVNRTVCRNVELFYSYKGEGDILELQPTCGSFATYVGAPKKRGKRTFVSTPLCGTHLYYTTWPGYLWFPYNSCTTMERYQVWAGAAWCLDEIEPMSLYGAISPSNNRHRGPYKHHAWTGFGCPLCACCVPWEYFNSEVTEWDFSGSANIVSCVDELEYLLEGWKLPPFGNKARDYFERYMTKDYSGYLIYDPRACGGYGGMVPRSRWMPSVIDNKTFYFSFNCFKTEYTLIEDCFNSVDQMNFFLNASVEEELNVDSRLRWEDVFHHDGITGYYPQVAVVINETIYSYFYYLKDQSFMWAWQEYWKDIEREYGTTEMNDDGGSTGYDFDAKEPTRLSFLSLSKPYYWYTPLKDQVRFITEEGEYSIIYTKPELESIRIEEEGGVVTDQEIIKLPTISINGMWPRCFDILYDNYDNSLVDWNDSSECNDGCDGESVYERTHRFPWDWFGDAIYGPETSCTEEEAEEEDRMYYLPPIKDWTPDQPFINERGFRKRFYNRGLVAHITKNDLFSLPMEITEVDCGDCSQGGEVSCTIHHEDEEVSKEETTYSNDDDGEDYIITMYESTTCKIVLDFEGVADSILSEFEYTDDLELNGYGVNKIIIKGYWGVHHYQNQGKDDQFETGFYYYCKPNINIEKYTKNRERMNIGEIPHEDPVETIHSVNEFVIENSYLLYPKDMLIDSASALILTFNKPPDRGVIIHEIQVYIAEYCDAYENIYVWERKYNVSTGGVGDNVFFNEKANLKPERIDPKGVMGYHHGPFYDFMYDPDAYKTVMGMNKVYGVFAKPIDIDRFQRRAVSCSKGNMFHVEYEIQKDLYEGPQELDPIGDELSFVYSGWPMLETFYKEKVKSSIDFSVPVFTSTSRKLLFDDHTLANQYIEPVFWQPGGHYFEWGSTIIKQNCYFNKPMIRDTHVMEFNCVGHGKRKCTMGPAQSYYSGRVTYQMTWYDLEYGGLGMKDPALDIVTGAGRQGGFGTFKDSEIEWGIR